MSQEAKHVHKEDLSRMEGAYGAAMIGKLKQMDVFISGLTGLGVETAKNLVLAGPHSVTIHDDQPAAIADLGVNFYLTEKDVGKPRSAAVLPHLRELNPNVTVNAHTGAIKTEDLKNYQVVCFTDAVPLAKLQEYNDFCHSQPTPIVFLYGSINGAIASIFADFGPKHHVFDPDGVPERTLIIDNITSAAEGVVTIDGDRHLLETGEVIRIEEVVGMGHEHTTDETIYKKGQEVKNINACHVVTEYKKNPKKFIIGDTSKLGEYKSGGVITTVKQGLWVQHKTLRESLTNAKLIPGYTDFTKFGRAEHLHFARQALWAFQAKEGRLPKLHDVNDAKAVVEAGKAILAANKAVVEQKGEALLVDAIDEDVLSKAALFAQAELVAISSLFGGILAQEITKQTGKFTPLDQWFHFDALEMLDEKVPADATPIGSRYDHQIAIFGKAFQDKLMSQKIFMVGCGALGCEYIKAIALMGLGVKGKVSITDDDHIELSNLSRQFLFRRTHVGKAKSICSGAAAVDMNPDLKDALKAYEVRIEPKTENVFDDNFWDSLDFVINALDNIQARKYADSKCVLHLKPLFESGTLGTQANSVVCLPHKTPSYSEGATAGETQGIAQCTLRNFPSIILHCIEWAKVMFDEVFVFGPDAVNSLLEKGTSEFFGKLNANPAEARSSLELTKRWLDMAKNPNFDTCMQVIFELYTQYYRNSINDLTHLFPADARNIDPNTKADLGAFWHGAKRFPSSKEFTPTDDLDLDFLYHGSNLLARIFNLPEVADKEEFRKRAAALKAPKWEYSGAKVDLSEGKADEKKNEESKTAGVSDEDKEVIERLKQYISSVDLKSIKALQDNSFEKDDDSNHHVDWVTAASNLRAWNYHIKPTTRSNVRMVAGRIIPAIATTTAMITGFIQLEVYKYIKGAPLEAFRAATVNLATNVFCVELLPDPLRKKTGLDPETYMQCTAIPEGWTTWDKVVINQPGLTTAQFLEAFKSVHHGAEITSLATYNGKVLYADWHDKKSIDEALNSKLIDLYVKNDGPVQPDGRKYILLVAAGANDKDGNLANIPKIQYYFA